jgi:hypothetical protein
MRGITHERVRQAASDAAEKLMNLLKVRFRVEDLNGVLACTYVAKEGTLAGDTKVTLEWKVRGQGKIQTEQRARNVLHSTKPSMPMAVEMPLLMACLPKAIEKHRLVPGMEECAEVRVICIGIPKHRASYETCTVKVKGAKVEHIKCEQVNDNEWLVHNGDGLNPKALFKKKISNADAEEKLAPIPLSKALDRLLAVAGFQAEVEKANVTFDFMEAQKGFETNAFKWHTKSPNVFVVWQGRWGEAAWAPRLDEVKIKSLIRRR